MRALLATGIAVTLAALAGGAQAREVSVYRGKCGTVVLPRGPTGLGAAIRVETSCGAFLVGDRGVRFAGGRRKQFKAHGLMFRRGRLVFYDRGRVVWAPSGRLIRISADHVRTSAFDERTRTLLYVSRSGDLIRTDGRRAQRLAALEPLRLGRGLEIVPLEDRRVALVGRRLVVFGSDGAIVASDRRRGSLPAITSRGSIALIATGPLNDRGRAREWVRLLRPSDRSSTPLFVNEVGALGCGHWPTLAWRGDQLLYSTSQGDVVVVDAGSGERVDLSALVRHLPGEFREAGWR